MIDITVGWIYVIVLIALLGAAVFIYSNRHPNPPTELNSTPVPRAQPSLPLLGNALAYKDEPHRFLCDQAKKLGPVFTINLAGLETTILSSRDGMKQFSLAQEEILSARAAVADFGFRDTLGDLNVFSGTDFHRSVIKFNFSSTDNMCEYGKNLFNLMRTYLRENINEHARVDDFMLFIRCCILTVMTQAFISTSLVDLYYELNGSNFAREFMEFQDEVENATASAAVLPLWLAKPVCLWKVASHRKVLVTKLASSIQKLWTAVDTGVMGKNEEGIWLRAMRSDGHSAEEAAELCVGLLFAAHKNAAIAAFQTILFILEHESTVSSSNDSWTSMVSTEAVNFLCRSEQWSHGASSILDDLEACEMITKMVIETLRLTAHSIGAVRKVLSPDGWVLKSDGKSYVIPCGSYVGVSHIVPHLDSDRWGSSCAEFDPNRAGLRESVKDRLHFTTFSYGVHQCPGYNLALVATRLMVVAILAEYDIHVPSDKNIPPMCFKRATLAQRDGLCSVVFERRKESTLK